MEYLTLPEIVRNVIMGGAEKEPAIYQGTNLLVDCGYMNTVIENARNYIHEERKRFQPQLHRLLKYITSHKIIISDPYKICDMDTLKEARNLMYVCYSINPFRDGNNMTNILFDKAAEFEKPFIKMRTLKYGEEFAVDFDTRPLAMLFSLKLSTSETEEYMKIVQPTEIEGILYLPANIEIIDILHNLYDLAKFPDYDTHYKIYQKLIEKCDKENLAILEQAKIGSKEHNRCKEARKNIVEAAKVDIVNNIHGEPIILIGQWAANFLKYREKICTDTEKLQVIWDELPDIIVSTINKWLADYQLQIIYRKQELRIPKDFRTQRLTFYIVVQGERGNIEKPFMDVFNCTAFELIGCRVINQVNIASNWVIMRFCFIDLYILRYVFSQGKIDKTRYLEKCRRILELIKFVRDNKEFEAEKYIGKFIAYDTAKKIASFAAGQMAPYYYPLSYEKKNGKIRVV